HTRFSRDWSSDVCSSDLGFDLYTQMLGEEIAKRKAGLTGEPQAAEPKTVTQIDLTIDAYLPSDYIYDSMQKIEIYKKVANIKSRSEERRVGKGCRSRVSG